MIGTLGHYQITSQLGKGGMGEVYQAKDQKLGRDVAIKVLPEEFAKDADRVARFQREAKVLASLNHPNIAAIYGLEASEGTKFLVLELVEGETLADRIKAGAIPVEESLKFALQIAEALEAAHEKGVIHRDLKPANIKVTPEGKVKILDFGLAKAFAGEQTELNLSNSPTLSDAATQQGVILGTAAYMSPEQARGKSVDKRADIWAFGCVLYEMLTGQAAFQGEDITEILASVVKGGANLDLLPANLHFRLREVIIRCLQKDLKKRYRDIGDVLLELEQVAARPAIAEPAAGAEVQSKWRLLFPWAAAAVVSGAIIAGVAVWNLKPSPPPEPRQVTRLYYELPKDQQFSNLNERPFAVSPDGRHLVYCTSGGLYLHSLDELEPKLIQGTGGNPQRPFFSPDGKCVGYWSAVDKQLKKISVNGGAPVTIMDITDALPLGSFSWEADGTIVFFLIGKGIMRVSASGGTPEIIVKAGQINETSVHPQMLPDGKSVLFSDVLNPPVQVMVQSLKSGERKKLFTGDAARYLPTGHIVYAVGDNLFAVPFDLKTLRVAGGPVSVVEGVLVAGGAPHYAVSDSGTLAYAPGRVVATSALAQRTLVWVNRSGKEEPLATPPNAFHDPSISPDGTKVALTVAASANKDIWIWDLVHKNLTRLTFEKHGACAPLWTPDSKRIAFASDPDKGLCRLYWQAADGTGERESLASAPDRNIIPSSWAGGGNTLVMNAPYVSFLGYDIGVLSMQGDRERKPLLQNKYNEAQPQISPDGRWMAYMSDESGSPQVYVRPFPEVNKGRWQVSTNGGDSPLWSRDGRELFYRTGDAVMAVAVKAEPAFSFEAPKTLFRGAYVSLNLNYGANELKPWDISPDGRRFLMMKEVASGGKPATETPRKINIVLNWLEELKQRVPVK